MSELRDLYQEVIIDHNRSPRNFRKIANASRVIEGTNPLCGDQMTLYVQLENNKITDIAFEGSGCAISKASASLMGSALKGKTIAEAKELFNKFHQMVTAKMDNEIIPDQLGKLAVFSGVREFPARVKCAMLAWRSLEASLKDEKIKSVSTE
jgi:nitrogen fixation NifU-like protein